jgi:hypothetical protein
MEKLYQLAEKCKGSVSIEINPHKDYYQTIEEYINPEDINSKVLKKIIDSNTLVELQFHPDSTVGFFIIYHYDLEVAIDTALKYFK